MLVRYRILIIDDEIYKAHRSDTEPRLAYYDKLSEKFDLVYLKSLAKLPAILDSEGFHFVLLDFFLDGWETTAHDILKLIPDELPVALISAQWSEDFSKMKDTISEYRDQIVKIIMWSEFEENRPNAIDLLIANIEHIILNIKGLAKIDLQDSGPIKILHISDLQFGSKTPDNMAVETRLMAEAIEEHWMSEPNFIVVTGDIAQKGLPSEYRVAEKWLSSLAKRLDKKWTNSRFFFVPGNHDVCWNLGLSARINPIKQVISKKDEPVFEELLEFAFEPYRNFIRNMLGNSSVQTNMGYWVSSEFRNYGLIFAGLNSCEELDSDSRETLHLQDETLARYLETVRNIEDIDGSNGTAGDEPLLLLNLIHHPVRSGEEKISNDSAFVRVAGGMKGSILNLCGHVHGECTSLFDSRNSSILEIMASTPTQAEVARPVDTQRGFNLITLTRDKNYVTGVEVNNCSFLQNDIRIDKTDEFIRDSSGYLSQVRD